MVYDVLILDHRISATDLRVWCVIALAARGGACTSTDDALADMANVSAPTVRRALLKLEEHGYISRSKGDGPAPRRIEIHPEGDGRARPGMAVHLIG